MRKMGKDVSCQFEKKKKERRKEGDRERKYIFLTLYIVGNDIYIAILHFYKVYISSLVYIALWSCGTPIYVGWNYYINRTS